MNWSAFRNGFFKGLAAPCVLAGIFSPEYGRGQALSIWMLFCRESSFWKMRRLSILKHGAALRTTWPPCTVILFVLLSVCDERQTQKSLARYCAHQAACATVRSCKRSTTLADCPRAGGTHGTPASGAAEMREKGFGHAKKMRNFDTLLKHLGKLTKINETKRTGWFDKYVSEVFGGMTKVQNVEHIREALQNISMRKLKMPDLRCPAKRKLWKIAGYGNGNSAYRLFCKVPLCYFASTSVKLFFL